MRQQIEVNERAQVLDESIVRLEKVNKQLAKLLAEKEALTECIISAIGHEHEGEASYRVGLYKITCKTPMIYSLDKKKYESNDVYLPEEFNPIEPKMSYTVNKQLCEDYLKRAPTSVRESLLELITKKPGKANVVLQPAV